MRNDSNELDSNVIDNPSSSPSKSENSSQSLAPFPLSRQHLASLYFDSMPLVNSELRPALLNPGGGSLAPFIHFVLKLACQCIQSPTWPAVNPCFQSIIPELNPPVPSTSLQFLRLSLPRAILFLGASHLLTMQSVSWHLRRHRQAFYLNFTMPSPTFVQSTPPPSRLPFKCKIMFLFKIMLLVVILVRVVQSIIPEVPVNPKPFG